jgi:two-component system LytT family response regulator
MSHAQVLPGPLAPPFPGRVAQDLALGFAYWLAFMLVLEPGDVGHTLLAGGQVAWDQETMRIAGGAMLGALSTPPILALVRRFPIVGPNLWRNAALHFVAAAAMSAILIATSCVLVACFLDIDRRPLAVALPEELVASLLLLTFNIAVLVGISHAVWFARRDPPAAVVPAPQPAVARLPVRTRAGWLMVEMAAVDWIETQGNYLALHVGARAHLIRETSARLEARLDPNCFVRIHRRAIVAVGRIREIRPLAGGDAIARLDSGAELRVSRSFRERVQARLRGERVW